MLFGVVIAVVLIGASVVQAQSVGDEVVNLRSGTTGTCPDMNVPGGSCEDTDGDGSLDTPVACRSVFQYTVPDGKRLDITDIFAPVGNDLAGIWTDARGLVFLVEGRSSLLLQSPFIFNGGETICPIGGSIMITGTLVDVSSGLMNVPITSQVGLAMLTLILGVLIGRRLRVSWV